jgi:uncharacterized protein (TIGR02266 family)
MASRSRLAPETAGIVQEFLVLNRRRLRGGPPLSPDEAQRWTELRWQIEEAMSGPVARNGNQRKALRVPSNLEVECSDSASRELGSAKEIAEGGIFLATERPFPVGTPLHLRLTGDGGETVEVDGAVVWVRPPGSDGGPPGMGIQFSNLDESQREAVAYLVEEALAAL